MASALHPPQVRRKECGRGVCPEGCRVPHHGEGSAPTQSCFMGAALGVLLCRGSAAHRAAEWETLPDTENRSSLTRCPPSCSVYRWLSSVLPAAQEHGDSPAADAHTVSQHCGHWHPQQCPQLCDHQSAAPLSPWLTNTSPPQHSPIAHSGMCQSQGVTEMPCFQWQ